MAARPLHEIVEPGWARALEPAADRIAAMGDFLRAEIAARRTYLPAGPNVLRAFQQPFDEVRVLIVGQDPYPTPGHAVGLSFSVAPEVRPLPGSLENIFRELCSDLGLPRPSTGDLTPWTGQGVLLLILGLYALGFIWLRRLATFEMPERFLHARDRLPDSEGAGRR